LYTPLSVFKIDFRGKAQKIHNLNSICNARWKYAPVTACWNSKR